MTKRSKSLIRQAEIVSTTLALLEEIPLSMLSTRQIAKKLHLSQPALFRHFRSKEDLLIAVLMKVQSDLSIIADSVLLKYSDPKERLSHLAYELLEHVQVFPGVARLLFTPPNEASLRMILQGLVAMQRSLVSQLVKEGQDKGLFRRDISASDAALIFLGLLQGVVLRFQLESKGRSLGVESKPLVAFWFSGLSPSLENAFASNRCVSPETKEKGRVCRLDMAPLLISGADPLRAILDKLSRLREGGVLMLCIPFRPAPLLRLLEEKGHRTYLREEKGQWMVDIVVKGVSPIDDLLYLEAPAPLERVLEKIADLSTAEVYLARLPRFPRMLLPHLEKRGLDFELVEAADGTILLYAEGSA